MRVVLGAGAIALGALAVAIITTSADSGGEAPPGTTVLANDQVRPWSCPSGAPLTATCLYVVSPADPTVQLFVVRIDTEGATGAPLLILGDGPSDHPSDRLREYAPLGRELGRDLVIIDPPGAGRSKPSLGCPELQLDPTRPSVSDTQFSEAVASCHTRLTAAGVDLGMVTTTATTDRIEDVRRALGIATWAVLTGGENSRLGLELARRSGPTVLEALILVSPHSGEYNPFVDAATPGVDALVEACAADATCSSDHGDLEAILGAAVAGLTENPFVLATGTSNAARAQRVLDSDALVGLGLVVADDAQRAAVPRLIATSIAEGDWSVVARAMADNSLDTSSIGALIGRRCAEDAPRSEPDAQEFLQRNALGWSSLFTGAGSLDVCTTWPVEAVTDPVAASDAVPIPVLLVRGVFDPSSRPDDVEALVEAIPEAVAAELDGVGGRALDAECAHRIIAEFLITPTVAPDTSCAGAASQQWES